MGVNKAYYLLVRHLSLLYLWQIVEHPILDIAEKEWSNSEHKRSPMTLGRTHICSPSRPNFFTASELQNSSHDISELHQIRISPNLEAMKSCKGRSGFCFEKNKRSSCSFFFFYDNIATWGSQFIMSFLWLNLTPTFPLLHVQRHSLSTPRDFYDGLCFGRNPAKKKLLFLKNNSCAHFSHTHLRLSKTWYTCIFLIPRHHDAHNAFQNMWMGLFFL